MRWFALLLLATPAFAQPTKGPQRCPAGQFVAGFEADGQLICEAPGPRRTTRPGRRETPPAKPLPTDAQGRAVLPIGQLQALLADPSQLARTARVIPTKRDGQTVGFKIFGVRRASLLASVGFKNGDIVETVAGTPLATVEQALQAYVAVKALKAGSVVKVTGTRRGKPLALSVVLK
jgi:type II secretory pathway component PulC